MIVFMRKIKNKKKYLRKRKETGGIRVGTWKIGKNAGVNLVRSSPVYRAGTTSGNQA